MKVLFTIQLIIYIFERRGKDESAGTCNYFSKATVKKNKVSSLQNPIFIETIFGRRELKHKDIYCRIRRSEWTVRAVSLSHEISSTTKAWVVKASKGSEFGDADHADTATHLTKGLKKFGEGQSGWSIPSSWQEYSVQKRFLCTVQKYVESILHKKSDRVQKVIQGQRRRKGSNEMEVFGLGFSVSSSNEEWTGSNLLEGQERRDKGHIRVPFHMEFFGEWGAFHRQFRASEKSPVRVPGPLL